ncbi:hypothetical protein F503_001000 [Ophiostoma piceae UAMH 11346]|uniref:Uncharacterized protein n=1 Tax=Ophiostoma piceae (strain UAMH 11346) TaxID=1262450 RepID=S3C620_OPHP1|nr:hypothetical protein F503_001000 [Ophiostoma piceae UAMH 11346]
MSSISYILGPEEDEQDLPPDYCSASGSASASGSRTDSHNGYYSSRPSSHNHNRPVTHPTEETSAEDYTGYENVSNYTMDPHTGYEPNQAHQYNFAPGQNFHAAAHAGTRGSRGPSGSRDGYYAVDHGAVAGFDPTTMTPIMHPGSTVYNAHYGSTAYGTAAAMDTNVNGAMQQQQQQHQQAEYNGEYVGDMAQYGEYQEETEVTPRTGRPSRAKKGKPVHNCLSCGRPWVEGNKTDCTDITATSAPEPAGRSGHDDRRVHDGYSASQHHPLVQNTHTAPVPASMHGAEPRNGRLRGKSHGESSKSSIDTSDWRFGSSPNPSSSSSIPRTPQDTGLALGHHLRINIGYSDKDEYQYNLDDPAISYMHAHTTGPLPHSAAVGAAQATSPTSAGYQYRHSHTSPSMAWPSSDNSMNSALASAFYRERAEPYMAYAIPAEGSADTDNCVLPPAAAYNRATPWTPSSSAVAAHSQHRLIAAYSDLHMQRISSGSSSDGWTPQSSRSGNKSS